MVIEVRPVHALLQVFVVWTMSRSRHKCPVLQFGDGTRRSLTKVFVDFEGGRGQPCWFSLSGSSLKRHWHKWEWIISSSRCQFPAALVSIVASGNGRAWRLSLGGHTVPAGVGGNLERVEGGERPTLGFRGGVERGLVTDAEVHFESSP